ncbi:hypothetical protein PAPYR_4044 [Paratrimastix pyriformis]|uniref:Uncharacterized protein n=1 Tax=Paratrimastix pyriformis TaxID=342808 RepID=A0ABQ8UMC8_9EUKA|nr:hypothetical protein PAPYR_4044 [Paratrimastix pyriformis]
MPASQRIDLTLLAPNASSPLCARLRKLTISNDVHQNLSLLYFLQSLTRLEELNIPECRLDALACIGHRLTALRMPTSRHSFFERLGRLEAIEIRNRVDDPGDVVNSLQANRATLRSVTLRSCRLTGPLFEALAACPLLIHLDLFVKPSSYEGFDLADVPQDLLDRLESLHLHDLGYDGHQPLRFPIYSSLRIASPTLRILDLELDLGHDACLTLDCPALETVTLPLTLPDHSYRLALNCPQMRQMAGLAVHQELAACQAMPRLSKMSYIKELFDHSHDDPCLTLGALLSLAPSITRLSGVCFARFNDFTAFLPTAPALRHLHVTVEVPRDGADLFLTADHLESLELFLVPGDTIVHTIKSIGFRIEAPQLRSFSLTETNPPFRVSTLAVHCRALADLRISSLFELTALTLNTAPASLRTFFIDGSPALDPACLLACLGQHGGLRRVFLGSLGRCYVTSWPELAAALGALPRLTELHPAAPQALLRSILVFDETTMRSLVLDCPLLEELQAPLGAEMERFELVGAPTCVW